MYPPDLAMSGHDQTTVAGKVSGRWNRKGSVKCTLKSKAVPHGRKPALGGAPHLAMDKAGELQTVLAGRKKLLAEDAQKPKNTANGKEGACQIDESKSFSPKSWKQRFEVPNPQVPPKPVFPKPKPGVASKPKTVVPPSGKETVGPPSDKETVGPPSDKETVGPPRYKETVGPPSDKETVGPPSDKQTEATSKLRNNPWLAPQREQSHGSKVKSNMSSPQPSLKPKPLPRKQVNMDGLKNENKSEEQVFISSQATESPPPKVSPPWASDIRKPNVASKLGKPASPNPQMPSTTSANKLKAIFEASAADTNNNQSTGKVTKEYNKAPPPPKPPRSQQDSSQKEATVTNKYIGNNKLVSNIGSSAASDSGCGSEDIHSVDFQSEDESWEDEESEGEKNQEPIHFLKVPSHKSSLKLRHSADSAMKRARRTSKCSGRFSNPEHQSASFASYEYDDCRNLASSPEEWETESSDDDIYEVVGVPPARLPLSSQGSSPNLPLLPTKGIPHQGLPQSGSTGSNPQLTSIQAMVPPLPQKTPPKRLEDPLRRPSKGDLDLSQKVPPPRPPHRKDVAAPALPSRTKTASESAGVGGPPLHPRNSPGYAASQVASPSLPPRNHVPPLPLSFGKETGKKFHSKAGPDTLVPLPNTVNKTKTEEALVSSMLNLMIPAPSPRTSEGDGPSPDGYIPHSPSPAGSVAPPTGSVAPPATATMARLGYLPMAALDAKNQKAEPRVHCDSSDDYIDPMLDIDSAPERPPPQLPPRQAVDRPPDPFQGLLPVVVPVPGAHLAVLPPSAHSINVLDDEANYLDLLGETETSVGRDGSIFEEEPLYQIYHCGVVAREFMEGSGEADLDEDDDKYTSIYEDAEMVKNYMSSLLSRSSTDSSSTCDSNTSTHTSMLETVVRLGAGTRKLWSEMSQVVESGVLHTLKAEDRKLQECLFEIITSEASYQKSLKVVVTHFLKAPAFTGKGATAGLLDIRTQHVLFSNVQAVKNASASFLSELEAMWLANCVLNPEKLCDLLTNLAQQKFDVYIKYCSNQRYQEQMLNKLRMENPEFRLLLAELERAAVCQGLTMQSFLALPMQRVTRLPLLVDAVCHRMQPSHPAYPSAKACFSALQKLVKQCNEGARQMENLEQVTLIDRCLRFKNVKKIAVVSQGRSLVKKGALTWLHRQSSGLLDKLKAKKDQLYLFLFNDLLIITKRKSGEEYQVVEYAPRISVHAEIIPDEDIPKRLPHGVKGSSKHVLVMVLLEKNMEFILACETQSERMRWVEAVTPALQMDDEEKVYESWDCPQVQALYKYSATQPDELSLEESDVINVSRKMPDGWYEGERIRDGERGWFPSNHTFEIHSAHIRAKNLRQRYRMLQAAHNEMFSVSTASATKS